MKNSLILTILNEEKGIGVLIENIFKQKKKPDEVVIVDGGSTDKTIEIIKSYYPEFKKNKILINLIIKKGAGRSEGRNIAINKARGEIIAVTDAGCVLKKDWFFEITKEFNNNKINAVAGFYLPLTKNIFEKCISVFVCVDNKKARNLFKKNKYGFLPSSRSIAFRKIVWEKTEGYPEKLDYCEDLFFDKKIESLGYKFLFNPKAIVYWPMRENINSFYKQIYNYALGDGMVFFSSFQKHSPKISSIFLRYLIFVFLTLINIKIFLGIFFIYIIFSTIKHYRKIKHPWAFFYLPILQIVSDFAVMGGCIKGISKSTR
jgi:glycosyltransferase involved in cell wall biosynthesis